MLNEKYKLAGFDRLCASLRDIDAGAADTLVEMSRSMAGFIRCENLGGCFFWSGSPQGHEYWVKLYEELSRRQYD